VKYKEPLKCESMEELEESRENTLRRKEEHENFRLENHFKLQ